MVKPLFRLFAESCVIKRVIPKPFILALCSVVVYVLLHHGKNIYSYYWSVCELHSFGTVHLRISSAGAQLQKQSSSNKACRQHVETELENKIQSLCMGLLPGYQMSCFVQLTVQNPNTL